MRKFKAIESIAVHFCANLMSTGGWLSAAAGGDDVVKNVSVLFAVV